MFSAVVETWGQDKGLVGVLSAVGKSELVLLWEVLTDSDEGVSARPLLNLGGNGATLKLEFGDMSVGDSEVGLREDVPGSVSHQGHLVVDAITLQELQKSC